MTKRKKIFMYSAFPLTEVDNYFKKNLIKPLTFKQNIDKKTYLPKVSGFPKLYLLKIEHELSLKDSVTIFSSFLNETDYQCIYEIAESFEADIEYIFLQTSMKKLYETYKKKKGTLSFEGFANEYAKFYSIPADGMEFVSFVQV